MDDEDWEPLFANATPIEQDDGPVPVVKIDYAPEFERVMGYFRRVLVDGEHSARALTLSQSKQKNTRANAKPRRRLTICLCPISCSQRL